MVAGEDVFVDLWSKDLPVCPMYAHGSNMLVKCKIEEAATINYVKKMKWQHRFICIMNSERGMRNAQLEVIRLC